MFHLFIQKNVYRCRHKTKWDFIRFFSAFFFFLSSWRWRQRKLNKKIVNFRNVNFHEMCKRISFNWSLQVNISTHFWLQKKLLQFNIQFPCERLKSSWNCSALNKTTLCTRLSVHRMHRICAQNKIHHNFARQRQQQQSTNKITKKEIVGWHIFLVCNTELNKKGTTTKRS